MTFHTVIKFMPNIINVCPYRIATWARCISCSLLANFFILSISSPDIKVRSLPVSMRPGYSFSPTLINVVIVFRFSDGKDPVCPLNTVR